MSKKDWFDSWFDSKYYHTLYRSRDEKEAKNFITRLVAKLNLPEKSYVLDLACGKGRHSRTLEKLGMTVLGADLSKESIKSAKKKESKTLKFLVHDMREVIQGESFDCIFNLFTSFGYFENNEENEKVLKGISEMLRPNGLFVFDYLNLDRAIDKLVPEEQKEIDGIEFNIQRTFDGKFIRKSIEVKDQGVNFQFEEKVRGFQFNELKEMMLRDGLKPITIFGNFDLETYDEKHSERMIIICKKAV
ncbi:class I SAM-dependent methyltransferase [Crocinitomicaceae bacterium]|jgi:2-polyprenyl-3-methyl-5-hydroxy-6-metoxy-1,4-benzoquinol methylase|nr:class I SAM-dependent methyltransferase [Crocinitomicaceae bacterium]